MTSAEAENGLRKLDATVEDRDHRLYTVKCTCGTPLGYTKMSRKRGSTHLGPPLIAAMAKQLSVTPSLWKAIAGCTKGNQEYLSSRGHWHHS